MVGGMLSPNTPASPLPGHRRPRGRPPKMAAQRDDGNRRQALLLAAARLFRQQGFAGTSTRDVASLAGMQPGSPFYHFPSKQALLEAVMHEGMERALASQTRALVECGAFEGQAALSCGDTARACLGVLVRHHFAVLFGAESDFIPVMLYEWRSLDDAQRARIVELKRRYEAAWVPVLEALSARGELRAPVPLARLLMFGALNWSVQWFDASRGMSLDEVTAVALQLFLSEVGA